MKFIVVSGGVVSGLGKGITTASLALLLKSRGYKVAPVKIDMYLNQDAGTIRPAEHGEVFVTHDGMETDEDLGHYERFMDETLTRVNYITTGQIYAEVLRKERAMEYEGEDVEAIPHVTDEIIRRIKIAGEQEKADFVIIELGGTVGEYQNGIFFEATRIMKLRSPQDLVHIHVTYLPYLSNVGELKSKPAQTSVHILNGMGIQPEIMVARSQFPIDNWRAERLALFTSIYPQYIFPAHDAKSVYEVPLLLSKHNGGIDKAMFELLHVKAKPHKSLNSWQKFVTKIEKAKKKTITIAMVGKYSKVGDYKLTDSYVCVNEALKHAATFHGVNIELDWISSDEIESGEKNLLTYSGIVVPQGWGSRGTEGKIKAAQYARENNIPYLGLCFGMQMASIEFGRNVVGLKNANSEEVDPKTKFPVIHVMPHQKEYLEKKQYGGTIRLGAWPCVVKEGTKLAEAYKAYGSDKGAPWHLPNPLFPSLKPKADSQQLIYERHRHRYEFNNEYRKQYEEKGFVFSGTSPDGELVEAIELKDHPFFVATQFHPEYESRPLRPHPLFVAFVKSCM
jgi:CTP synthase